MLGGHNHLCKDTVNIFVVVKEDRNLGVVSRRPIEELSEFSLHGLHCVPTVNGLAGWWVVYSRSMARKLVMLCSSSSSVLLYVAARVLDSATACDWGS